MKQLPKMILGATACLCLVMGVSGCAEQEREPEEVREPSITTGFDADGQYYEDGILSTRTGLVCVDDTWWILAEGRIDTAFCGFAENQYGWWYCNEGKVDVETTSVIEGIVDGEEAWWFVREGMVDTSYNGVGTNENGAWNIRNGQVDWETVGQCIADDGSYYDADKGAVIGQFGKLPYEINEYAQDVPMVCMNWYPDVPFGEGNDDASVSSIGVDGCGTACLTMLYAYYHDISNPRIREISELVKEFEVARGGMQRRVFRDSAQILDLPFEPSWGENGCTYDWDLVEESLRQGKIVVTLQAKGLFADGGHYLLLVGITPEGKILANDPWDYNWSRNEQMPEKFANGFDPEDITASAFSYYIYSAKK